MKSLRYHFAITFDENDFARVTETFGSSSRPALSALLGKALAEHLNTSFKYKLINSEAYSLTFGSVGKSEVFIGKDELVILGFVKATSQGGLLGIALTHTTLVANVFSPSLADANKLLAEVAAHVFGSLQKEPPNDEMTKPESLFFIAEEEKQHIATVCAYREETTYNQPSYDESELDLARFLSNAEVRDFVFRLVQARHLSEAKFSEETSLLRNGNEVAKTLISNEFLIRETFVECRKSNQVIAHFQGEAANLGDLTIKCGACNRTYKDENIYSAFVASERLRALINSSRWMSILITSYLVELGIPRQFIFWNVAFGTDEIDIITFVDGLAWIFELKDREFSSSDAHHFNYRRSIIKPISAFVVTTTFVSPDAKRVFDDVSSDKSGGTILGSEPKLPMPHLIEGLDGLKERLGSTILAHTKATARWMVRRAMSGLNSSIADIAVPME